MNKLRGTITCILIVSMIFLFGACSNGGDGGASGKSLYAHGIEMVSAMQEMASSEQYLTSYINGISSDTQDLIASAGAGDYTVPNSVYKVTVSDSRYYTVNTDELSEALAEHLESQVLSSFPQMINASGGNNILAASSLCVFQKVFVANEQVDNVIYLYTFEQATPVAIVFTGGEDNAVYARGTFIMFEGEKMNTVQAVKELFETYGYDAEVEEVTQ